METFTTLLALCAGNSPVTGEFPTQRTVTQNFDIFLYLRLNKRLSKQCQKIWLFLGRQYFQKYFSKIHCGAFGFKFQCPLLLVLPKPLKIDITGQWHLSFVTRCANRLARHGHSNISIMPNVICQHLFTNAFCGKPHWFTCTWYMKHVPRACRYVLSLLVLRQEYTGREGPISRYYSHLVAVRGHCSISHVHAGTLGFTYMEIHTVKYIFVWIKR